MFPAALSLAGAVVYGAADFFGGLAARRLRSIVVTSVAAASGLAALLLALPVIGGEWLVGDIAWGALSGVSGVLAITLLYACLAIGPMSILSPLTAVVSAVAPMLWGLLVNGEELSASGYAGLGVALIAIVMVGFIPGQHAVRPSGRGLVMAVGAGTAIGAFLVIIDQTSPRSGLVPLVLNRSVNLTITALIVGGLMLVAARRGRDAASVLRAAGPPIGAAPSGHADLEHAADGTPPEGARAATVRTAWWLAILCGIVDATANTILLLALRVGDLSIVSALTALYPAGTILLAAILLRERVARVQWMGLFLAVVAGGLLAVG